MNGKDIAKDLGQRADAIGISRIKLCAEVGITPMTFRRWINGQVQPRYDSLIAAKRIIERYEKALFDD